MQSSLLRRRVGVRTAYEVLQKREQNLMYEDTRNLYQSTTTQYVFTLHKNYTRQ